MDSLLFQGTQEAIDRIDPISFVSWLTKQYNVIADKYHCEVKIHASRSFDALSMIKRDLTNLCREMKEDTGTESLDTYKVAAFCSYWLRRRIVIHSVKALPNPIEGLEPDYVSPLQEEFIKSSSELCAFMTGYINCAIRHPKGVDGMIEQAMDKTEYFRIMTRVLKDKNISPHALYAIYLSHFGDLKQ